MNTQDYVIKKYEDIINQYLSGKDYTAAMDAVDRLAEFYLACTCPCEQKEWEQ